MIIVFVYSTKSHKYSEIRQIWEKISTKYKEKINIGEINLDYHPNVMTKLAIKSIPAIIFVHPNTFSEYTDGFDNEYRLERFFKGCIFYLTKYKSRESNDKQKEKMTMTRASLAWGFLTAEGSLLSNYNTVKRNYNKR